MQKKTNKKSSFLQTSDVRLQRGFTLIEMLVSIAILTLIIGSATGLLISAIRSQVKILTTQKLLDETSYTVEYMSRYLRMAKKDTTGDCIQLFFQPSPCGPLPLSPCGLPNYNYSYRADDPSLSFQVIFLDYNNKCHQFGWWEELYGGNSYEMLAEWLSSDSKIADDFAFQTAPANSTFLTSKSYSISGLPHFILAGESGADSLQPRVTFSFRLQKAFGGVIGKPDILIQTTISQRDLDI
jgi:prepilin-type N-terminal cleavage/methylation domain-containing protein